MTGLADEFVDVTRVLSSSTPSSTSSRSETPTFERNSDFGPDGFRNYDGPRTPDEAELHTIQKSSLMDKIKNNPAFEHLDKHKKAYAWGSGGLAVTGGAITGVMFFTCKVYQWQAKKEAEEEDAALLRCDQNVDAGRPWNDGLQKRDLASTDSILVARSPKKCYFLCGKKDDDDKSSSSSDSGSSAPKLKKQSKDRTKRKCKRAKFDRYVPRNQQCKDLKERQRYED